MLVSLHACCVDPYAPSVGTLSRSHGKCLKRACAGTWMCRDAFPAILKVLEQVISNVTAAGPECEVDVNNLAMRFAMDVTGIFIFAKDFGTARSFNDSNTDELFVIMKHCERSCMFICGRSNPAVSSWSYIKLSASWSACR